MGGGSDEEDEDEDEDEDEGDGEEALPPPPRSGRSLKRKLGHTSDGAESRMAPARAMAPPAAPAAAPVVKEKKRMSAAERKRLKKGKPLRGGAGGAAAEDEAGGKDDGGKAIDDVGAFRDRQHYIGYGTTTDESERERMLGTMSDVKSNGIDSLVAGRLEDGLLDITPDEGRDMQRQKTLYQWDKRHNKYVKRTLGDMQDNNRGAKKLRTESGASVLSKKAQANMGEMYNQWKSKSNKSIPSAGEAATVEFGEEYEKVDNDSGLRDSRGRPLGVAGNKMALPTKRHDRAAAKLAEKNEKKKVVLGRNGKPLQSELKSEAEIRKQRQKDEQVKIKNMDPKKRAAANKKSKEQFLARKEKLADKRKVEAFFGPSPSQSRKGSGAPKGKMAGLKASGKAPKQTKLGGKSGQKGRWGYGT